MLKRKESLRTLYGEVFKAGMKDGIPIMLGYFAVSFSLGIAASNAGLNAWQGFIASLLTNASAGEYAGFTVIEAAAPYIEMVAVILVANARYLLMSCALSQRMDSALPWYHRILIGFDVTDEIFGITIARQGLINPYYTYGAMLVSVPGWAFGTMLGIIAGNILPLSAVSALSVALYGMFMAVVIPPCKKNRVVMAVVAVGAVLSYVFHRLPFTADLSSGTKTIILTVVISLAAALICPVKDEEGSGDE